MWSWLRRLFTRKTHLTVSFLGISGTRLEELTKLGGFTDRRQAVVYAMAVYHAIVQLHHDGFDICYCKNDRVVGRITITPADFNDVK